MKNKYSILNKIEKRFLRYKIIIYWFFLYKKKISNHDIKEIVKDILRIKKNSVSIKNDKLRELDIKELKKHKTSDTIFILGSGSSINLLNSEQWDQIAKCDSIAFNLFFVHPFVPTYHHMEFNDTLYTHFKKFVDTQKIDFGNRPFIINYNHLNENIDKKECNFFKNTYFSNPKFLPNNKEKIVEYLNFYEKYYKDNDNYFHYRGSLSLCISLSVLLGYKKIVLLGIDLTNTEYFFQDEQRYNNSIAQEIRDYLAKLHEKLTQTKQLNGIHRTIDKNVYKESLTIDEIINVYNENSLKKKNIQLMVGSKSSYLYPMLPLFEFEN